MYLSQRDIKTYQKYPHYIALLLIVLETALMIRSRKSLVRTRRYTTHTPPIYHKGMTDPGFTASIILFNHSLSHPEPFPYKFCEMNSAGFPYEKHRHRLKCGRVPRTCE